MGKRDALLIKIDSALCSFNNKRNDFASLIKFKRSDLESNKKLKDTGHGRLCFVIGNGPSLRNINLKLIQGFSSFTVNGFYLGNPDFKSSYHLFIDPLYGNSDSSNIHIYKSIEVNPNQTFIVGTENYEAVRRIVGPKNTIYRIDTNHSLSGDRIEYDMTRTMTGSPNCVPVAIECALYMGFKIICLIGCDFSLYTKTNGTHFYDSQIIKNNIDINDYESNCVGNLIRCAFVHKQHYCLERTAERLGIKILNATEESLIDAYSFIELEKLLGKG